VDFAGGDRQVEAIQYFTPIDFGVQVFDLKH
jgi:hypothetical protein